MVAVDICNLALSYLGDTASVTSIEPPEGSAQAQHCARFYPMALNLCLEAHEWNFITQRAYLALVENCFFHDWRFVYALPSDATQVISVLPKLCYPANYFDVAIRQYYGDTWWNPLDFESEHQGDFQIEVVNGQQCILSNACDAIARYSCSTVQPGMFSAQFTNALARLLASMLAGPIVKGDVGAAEAKRQYAFYKEQLGGAEVQDANQRHGNHQPIAPWIRARQ